jgi:hypothetical protein
LLTAILASVFDLKQTTAITSFSILATHAVLNYSAIRLRKKNPYQKTFRAPKAIAEPPIKKKWLR